MENTTSNQKIKKFSNEFIVGIIVVFSIIICYFGYQLLKGRNIFENNFYIYCIINKVEKLTTESKVKAKGFTIGKVDKIKNIDLLLSNFLVKIKLDQDYHIPSNSIIRIKKELIGESTLEILFGNSKTYLQANDTTIGGNPLGFTSQLIKSQEEDNSILNLASSVLEEIAVISNNIKTLLDKKTINHIKNSLAHAEETSKRTANISAKLDHILDNSQTHLDSSFKNIYLITSSIAKQRLRISNTIKNTEKFSSELKKLEIDSLQESIHTLVKDIKKITDRLNNKDNNFYQLSNNKVLYKRIDSITKHLDELILDVKKHPGKYFNIEIFGRKNNGK